MSINKHLKFSHCCTWASFNCRKKGCINFFFFFSDRDGAYIKPRFALKQLWAIFTIKGGNNRRRFHDGSSSSSPFYNADEITNSPGLPRGGVCGHDLLLRQRIYIWADSSQDAVQHWIRGPCRTCPGLTWGTWKGSHEGTRRPRQSRHSLIITGIDWETPLLCGWNS